jgi:serine/threonine-protein kinase
MYAAATGQPPFSGKPTQQLLMMHLTQAPPPIAALRPDFPKALAGVIERCLAKNPDDRFANAEDLAEDIEALSLRQREIAPILRLFLQQATQGAQLTVVLLAMQPMLSRVMRQDQAIHIVFAVVSFTIIVAAFGQLVTRARHLVRLGFRHDDVKGAFDTTRGELLQARDQLIGDPIERRRIRNTRLFGVLAVLWGLVCFPLAIRFGSTTSAGGVRMFTGIGALLLIASAVGVGLGIALGFSRPARISLSQRLAARVWAGRIGRLVFARAERQLARARTAT